jgi:hypothetical protein
MGVARGIRHRLSASDRIGGPVPPSPDQAMGLTPYKGGYVTDRKTPAWLRTFSDQTVPRPLAWFRCALPKGLAPTRAAMGPSILTPTTAKASARDGR